MLFSLCFVLLCYLLESIGDVDLDMAYPESLTKELILWENMNGDEYVRRTKAERQQSLENRVRETQER